MYTHYGTRRVQSHAGRVLFLGRRFYIQFATSTPKYTPFYLYICTLHGYLGKLGMIFNAKKKSQAIVRSLLCAIRCVNLFHGRRATLLLDVFVTLRNELDGVVRVVSPKWDTHMPGRRVRDCRVSTVCRRVCAMFVYQPILSKQTHWESGVRRMC